MALTRLGLNQNIAQANIADEAINEAKVQISNAGSNGEFLSKQSGNTGGLTWAAAGLTGWSTGGTQNSLIPSHTSQGVYLGVSSATAANLLDDYEFGTFTPSMASTGGSFTTVGTCSGYYTKVGKMVQVQMELSITTVGSGSGNIDVTNLPFTSAATGLVHTLMMCRETQTMGAVYDVIMSRDVTACVILAPAMANGSGYSINGMYRVA